MGIKEGFQGSLNFLMRSILGVCEQLKSECNAEITLYTHSALEFALYIGGKSLLVVLADWDILLAEEDTPLGVACHIVKVDDIGAVDTHKG